MTKETIWILDSGAFSVKHSGATVSLEEYASFVIKYRHKFNGGAICLDQIGDRQGSYENWIKLRKLGVNTIPVFHLRIDDKSKDDGYYYLDKYFEQTDYVCVGGIARLNTDQRVYGLDALWDHVHKIGVNKTHKLHGLGLTRIRLMVRYPWFSVDSATAIKNAGMGQIFIPRMTDKGTWDYIKGRMYRVSDQAGHVPDSIASFYGLPHGGEQQTKILKYCQEVGYPLPETIEGRVLRPRKSRPGETRLHPFSLGLKILNGAEVADDLSNNYKMRELHNFAFFNGLVNSINKSGNNLRLYSVFGSVAQYDNYMERAEIDDYQPTLLVNYWNIKTRSSIAKMLNCEVKNGRETRRAS
jgi:hypothetical protein